MKGENLNGEDDEEKRKIYEDKLLYKTSYITLRALLLFRARIVAVEAILKLHLYFSTLVVLRHVRTLPLSARTFAWFH